MSVRRLPFIYEQHTNHLLRFLLSIPIGILGGGICASIILSFGALLGRSGTTGTEYVGYWEPALIGLGLIYGGFFGAFIMPIAYLTHLHRTGFVRAIVPATIGTIVGGCVGALALPPLALITGCIGFFVGLIYSARKKPSYT